MSTSELIVSTAPQKSPKIMGWLIAAVATCVSTYALDGVATAGGVLLVGSGVMAEVGETQMLLVLAGTYVAWAAGLRVNLKANFRLLEEVGTSSNALSKAAYDVVSSRTEISSPSESRRGRRVRRHRASQRDPLLRRRPRCRVRQRHDHLPRCSRLSRRDQSRRGYL